MRVWIFLSATEAAAVTSYCIIILHSYPVQAKKRQTEPHLGVLDVIAADGPSQLPHERLEVAEALQHRLVRQESDVFDVVVRLVLHDGIFADFSFGRRPKYTLFFRFDMCDVMKRRWCEPALC